jgi:broad specificity polyphosphatase/5'/3'-nucleotidase SurE
VLAAISQHHSEIITGCRVLTNDDGIQRALIDAANAATIEAFRMVYAASPKKAEPVRTPSRARKAAETVDQTSHSEPARKAPKRVVRGTKKSD